MKARICANCEYFDGGGEKKVQAAIETGEPLPALSDRQQRDVSGLGRGHLMDKIILATLIAWLLYGLWATTHPIRFAGDN